MIHFRHYSLILLLLASTTYAQKPKSLKKLKTVHIIDSCATEDVQQRFDTKGQLTEEVANKQTFLGSNNVVYRDAFLYDGGKTKRIQHFCNDTLISEELTDYKGDNLIRYREIIKGRTTADETYTYHKGKLQKMVSVQPGGDVVRETKYDNALGLKETTIKNAGIITGVEKEYRNGNTRTVEFYSIPGDSLKPSVTQAYIYDDNNNIIDLRTFNRGNETSREIKRYDDANVLVSHKLFENGKAVSETLYDLSGNILKETNLTTKEVTIYENKYNKIGDLVSVTIIKNGQPSCRKNYTIDYWEER
ncbi:hypothetical protein FMM05_06060 [Flavobacterium zepuense]|uniref:YD repeat-containing protein n=1 Tax=Flavobacterium zepuense TaxID=2593302 RepID=A0A552V5N0_9FLAO|nr:hypothetical protein [Flavobacterium zepuense]TRW25785.1 hypothetical protein FMM05_06060 [Flavobacterium zepuense]